MEQDDLKKEWVYITHPEAARVLSEEDKLRFLEPFIRREHSLSSAARELSTSPSAMLYQVKKLLRLGLLRVVRTEPRGGRAVKYYRATSERFFVPFEATSAGTVFDLLYKTEERRLRMFLRSYLRAHAHAPEPWGVGVFLTPEGRVGTSVATAHDHDPERLVRMMLEEDAPAVWMSWSTLRLDVEGAKALQRDLAKLFELYKTRGQGEEQAYLLHLELSPAFTEEV